MKRRSIFASLIFAPLAKLFGAQKKCGSGYWILINNEYRPVSREIYVDWMVKECLRIANLRNTTKPDGLPYTYAEAKREIFPNG